MGRKTPAANEGRDAIVVSGARQNNLKNLSLAIPTNALTVITGVSGSGKSSLAFDTLYAEGQRLYVETFSAYTRQFLDRMDKPAVDKVEGIPPAIAIDQTNPVRTSRSTVGTMTEINDHIKLLYARAATLFCGSCGREVKRDTPDSIYAELEADASPPQRMIVAFPVSVANSVSADSLDELVRSQGFRGIHDRTDDTAWIIQDRVKRSTAGRDRTIEALERAMDHGHGRLALFDADSGRGALHFSNALHCASCDIAYRDPVPNMFSFNSPLGACETCRGFGRVIGIDYGLVIPDANLTIKEGAIKPWDGTSYDECQRDLLKYARKRGVPVDTPWNELSEKQKSWVLEGEGDWDDGVWYGVERFFDWLGSKSYKMHIRVLLSRYRAYHECPACSGARLKPESLFWRIEGKNVHDVVLTPIGELLPLFESVEAEGDEAAASVTSEIVRRLHYLNEVGLGYLTLDRQSRTLSGGEVQRVNLTTALGTSLVNALFVLDEPSIGLHPRDVDRMIAVLRRLRDSGNTIIVVEHDPAVIQAADHIIDLGPKAGSAGGRIVFSGDVPHLRASGDSLTGAYLRGEKRVFEQDHSQATAKDQARRTASATVTGELLIRGACEHNLKGIDVAIPLHAVTVLTGVSGSGKSTLVENVLYRAAERFFGKPTEEPGCHDEIEGFSQFKAVVLVDQSSIGKSARSNPISYVGGFDALRSIFASLPSAKEHGLSAGHFSFNSAKGQCPTCKGSGFEHVEMQFLSDVYLRCPDCNGSRFVARVLDACYPAGRYGPISIADALELTVDDAHAIFAEHKKLVKYLDLLRDVGLGYLKLGQPVPTLSGGEAQRLKLAKHLIGAGKNGRTLFLFDEPTTGLHFSDIATLVEVFSRLKQRGNTVLIIEHNLDVIRAADWIVDLGPEGGAAGGELVFAGSPQTLMEQTRAAQETGDTASATGVELVAFADALDSDGAHAGKLDPTEVAAAEQSPRFEPRVNTIEIAGAREHNLQDVALTIPHNKFSVLTGVSGSGKSTIAFDIVFAEGQRRYLESLNAYARQFVQPASRAEVDSAVGIPPTVAIEQRTSRGGQKSTVATVTEIYQFLRLLYAKLGVQYCPECSVPIQPQSQASILANIEQEMKGAEIRVLAPLVIGRKGYYTDLATWAAKRGFTELRVDGEYITTEPWPRLDRYKEHDIELPFGPFALPNDGQGAAKRGTIEGALAEALAQGSGVVYVTADNGEPIIYSTKNACPQCGRSFDELDPRLFSFNSKHGWCGRCLGTGLKISRAEQGAIEENVGWDDALTVQEPCPTCDGQRLRPEARSVYFHERPITEIAGMTIAHAREFFDAVELAPRELEIARDIVGEMSARLRFLQEVGLGYLTLDRAAPTLSGGEAQRIRLAAQLGSSLQGVCYILDEPTIGLHPRDNQMLLSVLRRLTDKGNTVLVVEHDEETIRSADYIVDLGPGGGVRGGRVIASGPLDKIMKNKESITARFLNGQWQRVAATLLEESGPTSDREPDARSLVVKDARLHNLADLEVEFPLGKLICVTGVSGSGKSTLVREVLFDGVARELANRRGKRRKKTSPGPISSIAGVESIERALEVDQTPIGKTPRSTPATYIGVWDEIRKLFAALPESRVRGYTASRFSFNTAEGRCQACGGQGTQRIEMSFLPDVHVLCEECGGKRFTEETLSIEFKGKSISEVLAMDVEEAATFFEAQPKIRNALELMTDVGLGYLTLGQQSPTLSGGEAQRIKLVAELAKSSTTTQKLSQSKAGLDQRAPSALYILDEPTVGLHMADVHDLLAVLKRLVATGATVVVIEHNMELVSACDWVIDLGPEGGEGGGRVIASGTPRDVASTEGSYTGAFLARLFAAAS